MTPSKRLRRCMKHSSTAPRSTSPLSFLAAASHAHLHHSDEVLRRAIATTTINVEVDRQVLTVPRPCPDRQDASIADAHARLAVSEAAEGEDAAVIGTEVTIGARFLGLGPGLPFAAGHGLTLRVHRPGHPQGDAVVRYTGAVSRQTGAVVVQEGAGEGVRATALTIAVVQVGAGAQVAETMGGGRRSVYEPVQDSLPGFNHEGGVVTPLRITRWTGYLRCIRLPGMAT